MAERTLNRAKRGNADAFIKLCAPYEGMVYRRCLQILKNPADAQDAAQETMLRAFRSFASFEERSGLATWLYRIAHNVSLDLYKRAYRKRESTSLDGMREVGFEPSESGASPEDAYIKSSERDTLREAVETLPERQQAMLSLRYGDGMSYTQIAKAMNLAMGTVKSALSRAKVDLRAAIQKLETQ